MSTKKQIRENFRNSVFKRDKHKCIFCGKDAVDAHHITDRNSPLFINGGYVLQNGASLCAEHHLLAEKYHISGDKEWHHGFHPDDLYRMINSSLKLAIEYDKKLKD